MTGLTTIITAATAASNSSMFTVLENQPVSLIAWGFSGTSDDALVDLQVTYDGTTFVDVYKDGSKVQLKSTHNMITVYGPGMFRVEKALTTGSVGVALCQVR